MRTTAKTVEELNQMAERMRETALELAHNAGKNGAHLGGGLSAIEIMAVLYGYVMNIPQDQSDLNRDRFILSKGHGTLAYYTALYEAGLITKEKLYTFETDGGELPGQPCRNLSLGIETSSGSLGMGLSIGVGLALAAKRQGRDNRVYVLLGDGECNEGSVWEAAMSAIHFGLSNLTAIVDQNRLQSDGACSEVFRTAPLEQMWAGFGWKPLCVDGHNAAALMKAFDQCAEESAPCVILAQTVKGKGVSFMENDRAWHHGVLSDALYERALEEVRHG